MKRRTVLASLATLAVLPGCLGVGSTLRETAFKTTTDDCEWPQMCEGSTIARVFVNSHFSGDVVLESECRDEGFELQPGESKTLERAVDAETCAVALYVDDEEVYAEKIHDYESVTLRVNSSGGVDTERVEL